MSTASGSDRPYEAADLLEVMEEAVLYTRFLVRELASWAEGEGRLLDFGAGSGRFAGALHDRGCEMHAVEPDPALRRAIAARGVAAHESLEALDPGLVFDGIYSLNVLEHVDDDAGLLRAFRERLRPGGRLLSYVPAFPLLFTANDVRVGHLRRYRRPGLVALLRDAGYRVEHARYVDCLGFPAALAYRLVGDRQGDLSPGAVRLYDRALFPVSRLLDRLLLGSFGKNLLVTAVRS